MDRRLRPDRRIRRHQDFQQVYDQGLRTHGRLMTVFLLTGEDAPARLGVAATRKLGGAVQRNRAKRLVREVFRQQDHPRGLQVVVVPRPALLEATFEAIQADYASCLRRRPRRAPSR